MRKFCVSVCVVSNNIFSFRELSFIRILVYRHWIFYLLFSFSCLQPIRESRDPRGHSPVHPRPFPHAPFRATGRQTVKTNQKTARHLGVFAFKPVQSDTLKQVTVCLNTHNRLHEDLQIRTLSHPSFQRTLLFLQRKRSEVRFCAAAVSCIVVLQACVTHLIVELCASSFYRVLTKASPFLLVRGVNLL